MAKKKAMWKKELKERRAFHSLRVQKPVNIVFFTFPQKNVERRSHRIDIGSDVADRRGHAGIAL